MSPRRYSAQKIALLALPAYSPRRRRPRDADPAGHLISGQMRGVVSILMVRDFYS